MSIFSAGVSRNFDHLDFWPYFCGTCCIAGKNISAEDGILQGVSISLNMYAGRFYKLLNGLIMIL